MKSAENNILLNYQLKFLLQDSETSDDFHKKITDYFPAIIYIYDVNTKKLKYVNKKITEILGYAYADIEAFGYDITKIIFKEDVAFFKKELKKVFKLNDAESYSYQTRLNHKEGNSISFKTSGQILKRDEKGKPAFMLFVAQDISNEKQSDQEIKTATELFENIEELLQFGTWYLDLKTNSFQCSKGLNKLLGYEAYEFIEDVTFEFFLQHLSPGDAVSLKASVDAAIANDAVFENTNTFITKNGEKKIISTKGKTIKSENGIKIFGISHDITEQTISSNDLIHYRQMMLEKEEFLRSGSWEYDVANDKTTWSEGMYHLFEYNFAEDAERFEITRKFYTSHLSEQEIENYEQEWINALQHYPNFIHDEIITTKNGNIKKLKTYAKIIRNDAGDAIKVYGTTRDITELKEYEFELEQKLKDLDRSNKELEEFAYVASHDLQEPLRKITIFGERLQKISGEKLGADGEMYLTRMLAATHNMNLLIDNLLEFSRTTSKNQPFIKTDLNLILEEVKTELELKVEETKTIIKSEKLPVAEVIPGQIKQFFNNIFSNAIKFSKPSSKSVIKITSDKLSNIEKQKYMLYKNMAYYKISIHDNGIGFESEYSEKIFQMFQRLHAKSEYPGSGIGLAICKKIAENHNGILFAYSLPGNGATFTLILPEKNNNLK